MNEVEAAWVAGVLEGEGCFFFREFKRETHSTSSVVITVSCGMTDQDVVEKVHTLTGIGYVYKQKFRKGRKQSYEWRASKRADIIKLLREIRPHMGSRRGEKIDFLIDYIEKHPRPPMRRRSNGTFVPRSEYQNEGDTHGVHV